MRISLSQIFAEIIVETLGRLRQDALGVEHAMGAEGVSARHDRQGHGSSLENGCGVSGTEAGLSCFSRQIPQKKSEM